MWFAFEERGCHPGSQVRQAAVLPPSTPRSRKAKCATSHPTSMRASLMGRAPQLGLAWTCNPLLHSASHNPHHRRGLLCGTKPLTSRWGNQAGRLMGHRFGDRQCKPLFPRCGSPLAVPPLLLPVQFQCCFLVWLQQPASKPHSTPTSTFRTDDGPLMPADCPNPKLTNSSSFLLVEMPFR